MTPEQKKLARLTLGIDKGISTRNAGTSTPMSPEYPMLMEMVVLGLMIRSPYSSTGKFCFQLTPDGAHQAIEEGERLSPVDFPHES